jgi:peroxiredoxin
LSIQTEALMASKTKTAIVTGASEGIGSILHNSEEDPMTALKPGVQAPDFSLLSTPDQKVSLSDFHGQPVVLVFYPADWSPVCSDQLALYNELKPEFSEFEAQIIGISVDGVWSHLAFSKDRKLHFPLLADFEPKGAVARQYGVYREKDGEAERALFVIDAEGVIRWSYVSPVGINPGPDGILKALESTAKGEKAVSAQLVRRLSKEVSWTNPPPSHSPFQRLITLMDPPTHL